jgi:phenylalanyl-tRNA synthetase beta chain
MAGIEVSSVEEIGSSWERDKVVVGQVLKVERHPNADRLKLATVDIGAEEDITVVCGAPNVSTGQKIVFAKLGARLFNTHSGRIEPLRSANIRGFTSTGMVCSVKELGIGDDHDGILVLSGEPEIGTPLVDVIGDVIFETETTPNRPDCLSILGIAHEVAALTGQVVTEPSLDYPELGKPIKQQATVEIIDPKLCYRYTASVITNTTIGPSPQWLAEALIKAGQRPINNVVDITNYVMLEFNQPLHAFDFDKVKNEQIVVRQAHHSENLETLDGVKRKLSAPMLVIADSTEAIGLAGVMGGTSTEVSDSTTTIFLESANFDPVNTRRTATALKLSTGASYRFERSLRTELAPLALRRATQLILQIAGGEAAKGIIDRHPSPKPGPVLRVTDKRIRQVLGTDISLNKAEDVLTSLGFSIRDNSDGSSLQLKAPYWRSDLQIEDDVVEEIARIIGYDEIPTTTISRPIPPHTPRPMWDLKEEVRDHLVAAGMNEIVTYPIVSQDSLKKTETLEPIPLSITNPMSAQFEYLRTNLRSSILETLATNWHTSLRRGLSLFEIGRVYISRGSQAKTNLPDERETLIGALAGPSHPLSWLAKRETQMGFYDAKGVVQSLLSKLRVKVAFEASQEASLVPGRSAMIICNGQPIGIVGEMHPRILARFNLTEAPLAIFEIDLPKLLESAPKAGRGYVSPSRFPDSTRDIALVVNIEISSAQLEEIILQHKMVQHVVPFDVFTGQDVPLGKKSIAYEIVFQSNKDTLTSDQVTRALDDILRRLQQTFSAELRSQS